MTETTDIKALQPSERAKLGFVTDDNTGGYYVAECEECGQIFPSQTCEGGGQIADTGDYDDCYCPHCGFIDPLECDNANLVWNVQQLKIINLTSQLEAERQQREADEAELTRVKEQSRTRLAGLCDAGEKRDAAEKELRIRSHQLVKADASVEDLERRLRYTEETLIATNEMHSKAEAELAALRGEQEPVGFTNDKGLEALSKGYMVTITPDDRSLSPVPLFTRPPKPVVVPDRMTPEDVRWYLKQSDHDDGEVCRIEYAEAIGAKMWNACIDKIEAAGIVVKDGYEKDDGPLTSAQLKRIRLTSSASNIADDKFTKSLLGE